MNKELLIKLGSKIDISSIPNCRIATVSVALASEGIENTFDNQFLYVKDDIEIPRVSERVNNRIWMQKIARHRIFDDCKGCKYLDEEKHLGKAWCDKWDTDIWNVSTPFPENKNTVNKGCVPFRFFGYSPDNPMRPSQYGFEKQAMAKDKEVIKKFVDKIELEDIGQFVDENTFVGEFDPSDQFAIRINPKTKNIEVALQVKNENQDKKLLKEYPAVETSLSEITRDWNIFWRGHDEDYALASLKKKELKAL